MRSKPGRKRKTGGNVIGRFCSTCEEGPELLDYAINGDGNIERLSKNLSKINLRSQRRNKQSNKENEYIKF